MQQAFDRLVTTFFRSWLRFHPETAVHLGVHGYADELRPCADDKIGALVSLDQKMLSALDELDDAGLDEDRRVDRALLAGALSLELHELGESDWRYRDPLRFLPLEAVHQLMLRPVERFRECLLARLDRIPARLRDARGFLAAGGQAPPAQWVALAAEQAEAGAAWLRELPQHPKVRHRLARPVHLEAPAEAAARALLDYAHFLARDVAPRAAGAVACGRGRYEHLLRHRHFLDLGLDELEAVLRALREQRRRALPAPVAGPAVDDAVGLYRERARAARGFLAEHGLFDLATDQRLRIAELPAFLRPLVPAAALYPPVPGDPEQQGVLYVGTAIGGAAEIDLDCVQRVWPGRHLQQVAANTRPQASTLPRLLNASETLTGGWGGYCGRLMAEQGYLAGPAHRAALDRDALRRAELACIDLELHTGSLAPEAAADRLVRHLGLEPEQARAEVAACALAPTARAASLVGTALIEALREDEVGDAGNGLRAFHRRLLEGGPVALAWAVRRGFSPAAWERAVARLRDRTGLRA